MPSAGPQAGQGVSCVDGFLATVGLVRAGRIIAPADRTATPSPTAVEHDTATRTGRESTPVALRRAVCRAAAGTRSVEEFVDELRRAGVAVRVRSGR